MDKKKFAVAVEYRDVIHVTAENEELAKEEALVEFRDVTKQILASDHLETYSNAFVLNGEDDDNRFDPPREDMGDYHAITSKGAIVSILDMTPGELRRELGACYDVLTDASDALEDGNLDEVLKARQAIMKFITLLPRESNGL